MNNLLTTPFTARSTAADIVSDLDLAGRNVLITGGASGLGLQTARALANAGARVAVTVRRPVDSNTAAAVLPGVRHLPLDLADIVSVRRLVEEWDEPLDVLVANAGVMAIPDRTTTPQGWELHLATNFLGHFALARGLHPHLVEAAQRQGESRLVVVSSGAHRSAPVDLGDLQFERRPYDRWAAYGQSKTADVLLAVAADGRWRTDGVLANSLNPGFINTGLQRHLDDATMRALGAMDEDGNLIEADHYKTPEQGASTATLLAASPLIGHTGGRYFEDNQEAEVVAGRDRGVAPHALDPETADQLWEIASAATA